MTFINKLLTMFCLIMLLVTNASALAVTTFSGEILVGDNFNTTSNLAGLDIDIDGDGADDINVAWCGVSVCSIFGWSADVRAVTGSATQVYVDSANETNRFAAGDLIGPGLTFGTSAFSTAGAEDFFLFTSSGEFFDSNTFLGLRGIVGFSFEISGSTHYGWMDIDVNPYTSGSNFPCTGDPRDGCVRILGYGYETLANTAVQVPTAVPVPAAGVLFASGIAVLGFFRVKKLNNN